MDLSSQRQEILKKVTSTQSPIPAQYDPRPHSMRSLEELHVDLQNADVPCVLTQLLIPPVKVALHDLEYCHKCENEYHSVSVTNLYTCEHSLHCSKLDHYL